MMNTDPRIRAHTRYAFASIALMLLAFLLFVVATVVPLGLAAGQQTALVRVSLYAVLLFAVAGGVFSIRVAVLRKKLKN